MYFPFLGPFKSKFIEPQVIVFMARVSLKSPVQSADQTSTPILEPFGSIAER